jgi:hypothetical protein
MNLQCNQTNSVLTLDSRKVVFFLRIFIHLVDPVTTRSTALKTRMGMLEMLPLVVVKLSILITLLLFLFFFIFCFVLYYFNLHLNKIIERRNVQKQKKL